jgi:hypothetical protein
MDSDAWRQARRQDDEAGVSTDHAADAQRS